MESKDNVIVKLTFEFALEIIKYSQALQESRRFVAANQPLKSGTSIGANVREVQNAESKADFIHKFKIAAKEIEETFYWLELCKFSNYPRVEQLIKQLENISRIINKIIITAKNK